MTEDKIKSAQHGWRDLPRFLRPSVSDAILAAAPAFRKAAAEMARRPECKHLAALLISQPFDSADLAQLGSLLTGGLNNKRGGRGKSFKGLQGAELRAREFAQSQGVSLKAAAAEVAPKYGIQPTTLENELRRNKRAKIHRSK